VGGSVETCDKVSPVGEWALSWACYWEMDTIIFLVCSKFSESCIKKCWVPWIGLMKLVNNLE
jgi:hypothetical protein